MARYKIWDKQEDIFTLGKDENGKQRFTAAEYIEQKAPWAAIPGVKIIIGGGIPNGTVFMEYSAAIEHYARTGVQFPDGATPEEILTIIEDWEDNPPVSTEATAEERIAAALEYQNLLAE